jgi:alkyl sulfatase BDS1-like metallo-beta-lactamase superfamily hydrolase
MSMKRIAIAIAVAAAVLVTQAFAEPASSATVARNAAAAASPLLADTGAPAAAARGLIARLDGPIRNAAGQVIWDTRAYDFLAAPAPDTANPLLWRMAQLNALAGLFEVAPHVYQLRGLDGANMSIIEGEQGLLVVDPLTTEETARAGLALYYAHRPHKPVVAVAYSHSHTDHFGGVRGIVDEADVKAGKVRIYAPAGFMEHVVSETVLAGVAMARRAQYQLGFLLPKGPQAQIDAGVGKTLPVDGTVTLIAPTDLITQPYETRRIAGIEVEFQLTPGTEAPAEMNFYFPQWKALCLAENATQTMHNVLTPRGAEVRDPKAWAEFLDASLQRYGDKAEVLFVAHTWPTWGADAIRTEMADQRDMYKFINDRTVYLMNKGLTPNEISARITKLPGALSGKWYTQGFYGSLSFNVRAVYQRYLGFYDGNPADLDPLPPVEAAKRYVDALGGAAAVQALIEKALASGDYRWAATLGKHLVFVDPDNAAARTLQARALEQLGYQSENALWRNMYLSGAMELRTGVPKYDVGATKIDLVRALTPEQFFDYLAVRIDADKAQGHDMVMAWNFEDLKAGSYTLTLRNGVLTRRAGAAANADLTLTLSKDTLDQINLRKLDFPTALKTGRIKLAGDATKLRGLLGAVDSFEPQFHIVTP